jgi:hypothetical protein
MIVVFITNIRPPGKSSGEFCSMVFATQLGA